jgi:hypothetical protein
MMKHALLCVAVFGVAACSGEHATGILPMPVPGTHSRVTETQHAYTNLVASLQQRLAMLGLRAKTGRNAQETRDEIAETQSDLERARGWLAEASAANGAANYDVVYGPGVPSTHQSTS